MREIREIILRINVISIRSSTRWYNETHRTPHLERMITTNSTTVAMQNTFALRAEDIFGEEKKNEISGGHVMKDRAEVD